MPHQPITKAPLPLEKAEQQLIRACLRDDPQAQRQLYEQYKVPLFRLCLRYAGHRQEAEDFLQEGFLKAFSDLHQYRGEGMLGAWLRKVVLNVILQQLRRQKQLFSIVSIEEAENLPDTGDDIFSRMRARALLNLIQQLPPGYRTVFNLYVIEGYNHKETGELLGISENTSKSQLSKAKALLRKMLEKSMIS